MKLMKFFGILLDDLWKVAVVVVLTGTLISLLIRWGNLVYEWAVSCGIEFATDKGDTVASIIFFTGLAIVLSIGWAISIHERMED